ncbi:MAG: hypothetical protein AMS23_02880 [Bacteroides sp. SM1_62]|nr:MAG: hypothetical protein AMS23_02880 [Bacteroides sp. SM1_62]
MKKIALFIPVLLLPLMITAQQTPIDKLFKKYYGKEGFTTVLVTQDAFEVISHMEKEKGDLEGTLEKVQRVRVIAQEDEADVEGINFMDELKGVEFADYKELVVVKEADQEVLILAKEEDGKIRELLVIVGGEDNVLVSVEGNFTMDDLEALEGLDGLDKLDEIFDN